MQNAELWSQQTAFKMQNAECKMQNCGRNRTAFKMQNAECRMQN